MMTSSLFSQSFFEDQTMQRVHLRAYFAFRSPGITVPTEGIIFMLTCYMVNLETGSHL